MNSLSWEVRPYRAAFVRPFGTARGLWTEREGFWVTCRDADGIRGLGEVAPLPGWGTESLEEADAALQALETGYPDLTRTPAAYAGVELALLDYLARRQGLPLATFLAAYFAPTAAGSPLGCRRVAINALLKAEDAASLADEARGAAAAGYEAFKLKVGRLSLAADVERVQAVRTAIGDRGELRLDANGGWSREEAVEALRAFAPSKPAYVEQPVAAGDLDGLVDVERASGVRVAADEAVQDCATAERLLERGVRTLVLKPLALGGLLAAGAIALRCRQQGGQAVFTSVLDRGIGTAGVLHLAAALGEGPAAGLDIQGLWPEGPVLAGLTPVAGHLAITEEPGLGREVHDGAVSLR